MSSHERFSLITHGYVKDWVNLTQYAEVIRRNGRPSALCNQLARGLFTKIFNK